MDIHDIQEHFIKEISQAASAAGQNDAVEICDSFLKMIAEQRGIEMSKGSICVSMSRDSYRRYMDMMYLESQTKQIKTAVNLLESLPRTLRRATPYNLSHAIGNTLGPLDHAIKVLQGTEPYL
jgi:hypothetical protein